MKVSRAVKIKMEGKGRVQDIYSTGKIFTLPSITIRNNFLIFKESLPKDTPQWVKSYLNGVADCLHDQYYVNDLHFAYEINGKLYSIHRNHPNYYEKHGFKPSDLSDKKGGHYWMKNDKPFFVSKEVENEG